MILILYQENKKKLDFDMEMWKLVENSVGKFEIMYVGGFWRNKTLVNYSPTAHMMPTWSHGMAPQSPGQSLSLIGIYISEYGMCSPPYTRSKELKSGQYPSYVKYKNKKTEVKK